MSDVMEILTGLVVFAILVWPVAGYIWFVRWIGRREEQALAEILQKESSS